MTGYLRQSTASQVGTIGPFVDDTDFNSLENALTINNTDILLKKNGAASAAKNSGGATADGAGGLYHLTWDAADTATVGELVYSVKVAGALVVFGTYVVLEEPIYDLLFVSGATGLVTLAAVTHTGAVIPTVSTLTGHTAQTGDNFARLGAPAGASVSADVAAVKVDTAAILVDTGTTLQAEVDGIQADTEDIQARLPAALTIDGNMKADTLRIGGTLQTANDVGADTDAILVDTAVIGAAGAGLTAVPWNASWDAEVQSEVDDALVAQRLDELVNADSDIDGLAPPTVGSVVHELLSKTAGSFTYDQTTDSLEAIRDKETDIETDTTEIGAAGAGLTAIATQASVNLVDDFLDTEIAAILTDTGTTLDDFVDDLEARFTQALADKLAAHALSVLTAVIDARSTTTAVKLSTVNGAAPSAVDDFYNGGVIVFTSGALLGQRTDVTDYVGATTTLTVTALTGAPADTV